MWTVKFTVLSWEHSTGGGGVNMKKKESSVQIVFLFPQYAFLIWGMLIYFWICAPTLCFGVNILMTLIHG